MRREERRLRREEGDGNGSANEEERKAGRPKRKRTWLVDLKQL